MNKSRSSFRSATGRMRGYVSAGANAFAVGATVLLSACGQSARANTVQQLASYNFIDNWGPDALLGISAPTLYLGVGGDFVPNPPGASISYSAMQAFAAQTTVTASQGGLTTGLQYLNSPILPNQWFAEIPYSPSLTGPWQLSVTNPSTGTSNFSTYAIPANTPVLPLVTNIKASSNSAGATISWSSPSFTVPTGDQVSTYVFVYDSQALRDVIQLAPNVTSYDLANLPSGLASDQTYIISVQPFLFDETGTRVLSVSRSFLDFSPTSAVPEPSTWAMMLLGFACVGVVTYRRSRELRIA